MESSAFFCFLISYLSYCSLFVCLFVCLLFVCRSFLDRRATALSLCLDPTVKRDLITWSLVSRELEHGDKKTRVVEKFDLIFGIICLLLPLHQQ